MPRVIRVLPADTAERGAITDTLILPFAQRQAARGVFASLKGAPVEIDPTPLPHLRSGDRLQLEDGSLVELVAEPEHLLEARADDLPALARLAWHLGDRHMPVEMLPNRLRVRRDAAAEALLARLGARVTAIEAPFEPEGGAYTPAHRHHYNHRHDDCHRGVHNHDHHRTHEHDRDHSAGGGAASGHFNRRSAE